MSSGQAGYYLGLAREDYYLEGGEPPGKWYGEGAEKLGLTGLVQPTELYNLFDGLSPDGSIPLVQLQNHEGKAVHRPGWDLTFSAPKSVSVLWSQSSEDVRHVIQQIHEEAVKRALDYLQKTSCFCRAGRGGHQSVLGKFVVALFEHGTSRSLDPQLHTHALLLNVASTDEGFRTLSSLQIYLAKMTAGALYRLEMAHLCRQELGLKIVKTKHGFEIADVPIGLMEIFSKRREAIQAEIARRGIETARGAAIATVETRESKELASRADLFDGSWSLTGRAFGWSRPEAGDALGQASAQELTSAEREVLIASALNRLMESHAHFTESEFIRAIALEAVELDINVDRALVDAQEALKNSAQIVPLGEYDGTHRYTTVACFEMESQLLDTASQLAQSMRHQVPVETLVKNFVKHGDLSEEHLQAAWRTCHDSGALSIISGIAGSGKTRMMIAARECWEREGNRVIGAALGGQAAVELGKGSGIGSVSIARLFANIAAKKLTLNSRTILVVDEAGMVATPEMLRLVTLCHEAGSKLVLVGEGRQIQAIGQGGALVEMGERYGVSVLTQIVRQKEDWAKQVVIDMAEGRAKEAITSLASRGSVHVFESRDEAKIALVAKWAEDGYLPSDTLLLAATRREVADLNTLAQEARYQMGKLGETSITLAEQTLFEGDRVVFRKGIPKLDVENGFRGTLLEIKDGDILRVRLDSGKLISISTNQYDQIELGYADTTHAGQGATKLSVYILVGGKMQDRELSYVQVSRAVEKTELFVNRADLGDEMADLARDMARSHQKDLAHTVMRRSQIEPSL